jgi:hypothetical protein
VSTDVKDSPNKLSIVNIPQYIEEEQVRELVETMGKLNAFVLVKDTSTGQHRVSRTTTLYCFHFTNPYRELLSASMLITRLSMPSLKVSTIFLLVTVT